MLTFFSQTDDELDPEEVVLDDQYALETRSKSSAHTTTDNFDEYPDDSGVTNARVSLNSREPSSNWSGLF